MKIRSVTLAMMALMLSAGPLMAMDSDYQDRKRHSLNQRGDDAGLEMQETAQGRQQVHSPRYLLGGESRQQTPGGQAPWWL